MVQECTDDEVTVDDFMEVGSCLMLLAVQKHSACRAPPLHQMVRNTFVLGNSKRKFAL